VERHIETVSKGLTDRLAYLAHRLPLESALVDHQKIDILGRGLTAPGRPEEVDRLDAGRKLGAADAVS
jgi:hypothetical protein